MSYDPDQSLSPRQAVRITGSLNVAIIKLSCHYAWHYVKLAIRKNPHKILAYTIWLCNVINVGCWYLGISTLPISIVNIGFIASFFTVWGLQSYRKRIERQFLDKHYADMTMEREKIELEKQQLRDTIQFWQMKIPIPMDESKLKWRI